MAMRANWPSFSTGEGGVLGRRWPLKLYDSWSPSLHLTVLSGSLSSFVPHLFSCGPNLAVVVEERVDGEWCLLSSTKGQ